MKQEQALEILKSGENVFLTGQAGSGKTFVLNQYIKYLREHQINVSITATTGIAATHIGGLTIHSWSGMGIKDQLSKSDFESLIKKRYLRKNILNTDVLLIDEISMLHAHQLDLVNQICQAFRQNLRPFGGLQVVMAGDFFQLPPISQGERGARGATEANVWPEMQAKVCYLDEQYRQTDSGFIDILNEIRQNNLSQSGRERLFFCLHQPLAGKIEPTKLYTHNIDVDRINAAELEKISGASKAYDMFSDGREPLTAILQKGCLAPERLILKIGAKVMFVKNNFELGVVNGTVGVVIGFDDDDYPIVETKDGMVITALPAEWAIEDEGRIMAKIRQIPLRLAWAITVHKSQGLSLDLAEVDLSKAFVPGMGYVALSRVRSLDGLRLVGLNEMALRVDDNVLTLDQELRVLSQRTEAEWSGLSAEERQNRHNIFLKIPLAKPKKVKKSQGNKEKTRQLLSQKMSLPEMARELGLTIGTIVGHVEKIATEHKAEGIGYLLPPESDVELIAEAFNRNSWEKLRPVYDYLEGVYSFETLRLVRVYLKGESFYR